MASLLRQIVAGPRSRHPEAGLDLCYVTDQIIATSGPSGTYPQRAYRNPLDQLVKFLDYKHGEEWAIWEFRAEGTGYPDSEVYGRVWHYPWPDHHPPPFRLVPMIMAGMRNWLNGEGEGVGAGDNKEDQGGKGEGVVGEKREGEKKRVVVVHCKAGKGRSGTMACSYLISECGWEASEALARFTERRMRPGFGQGVSIPSQLRWVGYVDRWTKGGKLYVDRQVEIMEVHVWGLREGVKVQVEGFVDEGKTIKLFHVFTKKERVIVDGNTPGGGGIRDKVSDMAGFKSESQIPASKSAEQLPTIKSPTIRSPIITSPTNATNSSTASIEVTGAESGGGAVIFKPSTRVILPTSDINIDFERRNKASMGWTMVTAVAHVWFNVFFEGRGPEQNGVPDDNGVFEIEWDKMDGIKGSSRKGTRAFDKLSVVWQAYEQKSDVIREPGTDSPVPQMEAADWKGGNETQPSSGGKELGLRTETAGSADVSKASSVNGDEKDDDTDSERGVKPSGPGGEEELDDTPDLDSLPSPKGDNKNPTLEEVTQGLDTASATTGERDLSLNDPSAATKDTSSTDLNLIPEDNLKDPHHHTLGLARAKKSHTIDL